MNNFRIDVASEGREQLRLALSIVVGKSGQATHYRLDEQHGWLILYWTAPHLQGASKFPGKMGVDALVPFIESFLSAVPRDKRAQKLDHDGSSGEGWRLFNEAWGHVNGEWEALCAVEAIWAWYGK